MYLNLHRPLAVMVVLVQMSSVMYVECVEGTGAHAHGARFRATFQAGGAEWNYNSETVEPLECTGPLNTGVDIQMNY